VLEGTHVAKYIKEFGHFAECIRNKIIARSDGTISVTNYPEEYTNIIAFIDCVVVRICRIGSGPKGNGGSNQIRDHTNIQQCAYNGYKHSHGIKFQSIEFPNGMCGFMFGPCSNIDNDSNVKIQSNIDGILGECEDFITEKEVPKQFPAKYITYGDSAYIRKDYTNDGYVRGRISPPRILKHHYFNYSANSARTSVEHGFGRTSTLFPFVVDSFKFKLLQNSLLKHYYEIATLFRNIYVILNGTQTSTEFNCYRLPSLEDYLSSENMEEIICKDSYDTIDEEIHRLIEENIKKTV
jgi:hypothetical protein